MTQVFISFLKRRRILKDLIKAHHLTSAYGFDDMIFSHLSCRCPKDKRFFYLSPFHKTFQTVSQKDLRYFSLEDPQKTCFSYRKKNANKAGYIVHQAIYKAREDVNAIIHWHTPGAIAVASQDRGLLFLSQWSMLFYGHVGYHDFEGISLDASEQARLVNSLGENKALLLRHHGLITVGESIGEAFMSAYYLEKACKEQIFMQSSGEKKREVPDSVKQKTYDQLWGEERQSRMNAWKALNTRYL